MIPHAPPMRFPIVDGRVLLPSEHPLCTDGIYPALALLELAAQAAGHSVSDLEGAHGGMLVEVESCTILRPVVSAGEVLGVSTTCERVMGPLRRYRVRIEGVLEAGLTLRITA